jgi:hypothetical protein
MKITLDEWLLMERRAFTAAEAKKRLDNLALELSLKYNAAGDKEEAMLLLKIADRDDVWMGGFSVQSEWTGGPSDEPGNTTFREPHFVSHGHRFPPEQVDKYRQADGEPRLPQRMDAISVARKAHRVLSGLQHGDPLDVARFGEVREDLAAIDEIFTSQGDIDHE